MIYPQRLIAMTLLVACAFSQQPANAAALKAATAACQDKDVFKKAFQIPSDKDGKKAAAYFQAKIGDGKCQQFPHGQEVSVDERDGAFWCVRPSGGLECYWTLEKAVDLNPPKQTTSHSGSPRQKRGR